MSVYHTVWVLVITLYRQVTDILPTHHQLSADCRSFVGRPTDSLCFGENLSADKRPTDGRQSANRRPTVGRQTADSRPTDGRQSANRRLTVGRQVFWGALLHNYPFLCVAALSPVIPKRRRCRPFRPRTFFLIRSLVTRIIYFLALVTN